MVDEHEHERGSVSSEMYPSLVRLTMRATMGTLPSREVLSEDDRAGLDVVWRERDEKELQAETRREKAEQRAAKRAKREAEAAAPPAAGR